MLGHSLLSFHVLWLRAVLSFHERLLRYFTTNGKITSTLIDKDAEPISLPLLSKQLVIAQAKPIVMVATFPVFFTGGNASARMKDLWVT